MLRYAGTFMTIFVALLLASGMAAAEVDLGGVWIKTTHSDPQNVTIVYVDGKSVKAMGYGQIAGAPAIWYAEGRHRQNRVELTYRYSPTATPLGWEPEGTMTLTVSKDGNTLSGKARSRSGGWSGPVEFRRIVLQPG